MNPKVKAARLGDAFRFSGLFVQFLSLAFLCSAAAQVPTNRPPVVSLNSPTNGSVYAASAIIPIYASAFEPSGIVAKVEFFDGSVLLALLTPSNNPANSGQIFYWRWTNASVGPHTLTAKGTDNQGASTISSPAAITVLPPPTNQPPIVAIISPITNAAFAVPTNVTVSAAAYDRDGSILKVEFFANNISLGSVSGKTNSGTTASTLYSIVWPLTNAGSYTLTAKATDNQNATTVSAPVNVTAYVRTNQPPKVSLYSPTNGALYAASSTIPLYASAYDPDGTVAKVDFFDGSALLASVTPTTSGSANGQTFSWPWTNAPVGQHTLTAKATDNQGASTISSPAAITVLPAPTNQPPKVTLYSPTNGAVYAASTAISLFAAATDSGGTIATIEFFDGTALLISVKIPTNGPTTGLSYFWTNAPVGQHTVTARATDNHGASAVSSAAAITVLPVPTNQQPVVTIVTTDRYASEPVSNIVKAGKFTVSRTGDNRASLIAYYSIGGTASNGVDYATIQSQVLIPAGATNASIVISPLNDTVPEAAETVILTLIQPPPNPAGSSPSTGYGIGSPSNAVVYLLSQPSGSQGTNSTPGTSISTTATQKMINASVTGDGTSHVAITGTTGDMVVIEVSTDLVNWTYLGHGYVSNGQLTIDDSAAKGVGLRFYRAISP